jgi:hypothetical protein
MTIEKEKEYFNSRDIYLEQKNNNLPISISITPLKKFTSD